MSETLIVRSNGSSPLWTRSSVFTVASKREERPQQVAAESLAGDLDLLGQADFFVPRQQRNLRHLRQVHADRIARSVRHAVVEHEASGRRRSTVVSCSARSRRWASGPSTSSMPRPSSAASSVVDAIGAFDLIGQEAADFFVGESALGFALGDQFLESGVDTRNIVRLLPHFLCGWVEVRMAAAGLR